MGHSPTKAQSGPNIIHVLYHTLDKNDPILIDDFQRVELL
jgi:hypothetical protein